MMRFRRCAILLLCAERQTPVGADALIDAPTDVTEVIR